MTMMYDDVAGAGVGATGMYDDDSTVCTMMMTTGARARGRARVSRTVGQVPMMR